MLIKKTFGLLYWEWHSPQSPRPRKRKAVAVAASGDDYHDDDMTRNVMAFTTNKVLLGERNLVLRQRRNITRLRKTRYW